MQSNDHFLPFALATTLLLSSSVYADFHDEDEDEIEFEEAHIFFELNNTDGDLGIHALIDGGPWKKLEIESPTERTLLKVNVRSKLRRQGLTEFFFESAEPTFDELDPADFFARFPAGIYEIEGRTLDGQELESEAEITHLIPAPPATSVNGTMEATQCDDEEDGFDAPEASAPITIAWDEVELSHPVLGSPTSAPVSIHNYEVVVEAELEIDGEEFPSVMSVTLPSDSTSMSVPAEFLALLQDELDDEGEVQIKYEVLAREESYNQTATESCFLLTP